MKYITEDCSGDFIQFLENNHPDIIIEWESLE